MISPKIFALVSIILILLTVVPLSATWLYYSATDNWMYTCSTYSEYSIVKGYTLTICSSSILGMAPIFTLLYVSIYHKKCLVFSIVSGFFMHILVLSTASLILVVGEDIAKYPSNSCIFYGHLFLATSIVLIVESFLLIVLMFFIHIGDRTHQHVRIS